MERAGEREREREREKRGGGRENKRNIVTQKREYKYTFLIFLQKEKI